MTSIIVGVEDFDRSIGALVFARGLAAAARARLILATAYRQDGLPSQAVYPEIDRQLRNRAEDVLAAMRAESGDVATETRALADSSPARALHALAEREAATLIVIGSSHRGTIGRVLAGTTAERLLHGSPCPVAVVPKGRGRHHGAINSVLVAYDGTVEATAALEAALTAGRTLSAAVRVVWVHERRDTALGMAGLGMPAELSYTTPPAVIERQARERFEADIAARSGDARVQSEFVVGDPVEELAKRSESADLLVTGSRGYGPMRAVLLGSVSGRLVREADCPVIVVPRGADSHLDLLFAERPGSRAA